MQCEVTLGKSDPPWVTPAGCDREVKATFPQPKNASPVENAVLESLLRRTDTTRMPLMQCEVTLGKSDPPWVTPAGCEREVKATFPRPKNASPFGNAVQVVGEVRLLDSPSLHHQLYYLRPTPVGRLLKRPRTPSWPGSRATLSVRILTSAKIG